MVGVLLKSTDKFVRDPIPDCKSNWRDPINSASAPICCSELDRVPATIGDVVAVIVRSFSVDSLSSPCYALMGVTRGVFCSTWAWPLALSPLLPSLLAAAAENASSPNASPLARTMRASGALIWRAAFAYLGFRYAMRALNSGAAGGGRLAFELADHVVLFAAHYAYVFAAEWRALALQSRHRGSGAWARRASAGIICALSPLLLYALGRTALHFHTLPECIAGLIVGLLSTQSYDWFYTQLLRHCTSAQRRKDG
eukprot:g2189.t1